MHRHLPLRMNETCDLTYARTLLQDAQQRAFRAINLEETGRPMTSGEVSGLKSLGDKFPRSMSSQVCRQASIRGHTWASVGIPANLLFRLGELMKRTGRATTKEVPKAHRTKHFADTCFFRKGWRTAWRWFMIKCSKITAFGFSLWSTPGRSSAMVVVTDSGRLMVRCAVFLRGFSMMFRWLVAMVGSLRCANFHHELWFWKNAPIYQIVQSMSAAVYPG